MSEELEELHEMERQERAARRNRAIMFGAIAGCIVLHALMKSVSVEFSDWMLLWALGLSLSAVVSCFVDVTLVVAMPAVYVICFGTASVLGAFPMVIPVIIGVLTAVIAIAIDGCMNGWQRRRVFFGGTTIEPEDT